MDNTNRLTWWRLCLLITSASLNACLLLALGWLLVNFVGAEYRSREDVKTVAANHPVGLSLVSLVEEALQGREKREILDMIESIYSAHPDISVAYKGRFRYPGRDRAQGKDCIRYGGEFLVFWGETFASFDADFKCHPEHYSYEFRGRNWSAPK